MKITIEFDTPQDKAVQIAQSVINASIEKSKERMFPPGGVTHFDREREEVILTPRKDNITCPECGALYGAHKEDCSKSDNTHRVGNIEFARRFADWLDESNNTPGWTTGKFERYLKLLPRAK